MTFYANDVHPIPPDHGADDCDDQLPLISRVGRGIKGDSSRVRIVDPDSTNETYLEGGYWDEADKSFHSEWISENINGGELSYQYNLRPYTIPRTFTITFIYRRPGRPQWSWTTPAIPYIWTLDAAGKPDEDPDHIVGSGVATLFVRAGKDKPWNERLHYPKGTTRDDFNAPEAEEGWSATITFGKGGDVELPNFDELAKIIGISKNDIFNILDDKSFTIDGISAKNLIEYINKCDKRDLDHIHADLGFNSTGHGANTFGGKANVKAYIDDKVSDVAQENTKLKNAINDILNKIYGGGEMNQNTGHIIWPNESKNSKIPVADLNIWGGDTNTGYANAIRSRAENSNNDLNQK